MIRVPADQPGEPAGKKCSDYGNHSKFIAPTQADNGSKQRKRHSVRHKVPPRAVQKRRPKNPQQTTDMTRPDAILVEMTIKDQIVDDKDGPTKRYQRKDRRKSFEHRTAFKISRWHDS